MSADLRSTLGGRVRMILALSSVNIIVAELTTAFMASGFVSKTGRLGENWRWAAIVGFGSAMVAGVLPPDGPETTPFTSTFKTQLPFALMVVGLIAPASGFPGTLAVMIPVAVLTAAALAFMKVSFRHWATRGRA